MVPLLKTFSHPSRFQSQDTKPNRLYSLDYIVSVILLVNAWNCVSLVRGALEVPGRSPYLAVLGAFQGAYLLR